MKPRKKMSDEDFEQRYLAEKDCLLEYETARAYYDEHMRPHNPDESFDDYCNRQLLQPASRIKLVCKQCGKVCAEEDEGPDSRPKSITSALSNVSKPTT
jgi:hypothetical protein